MAVLANVTWQPGPTVRLQRQYIKFFSVGWWTDTALLEAGNPSLLQEPLYGGYRCVLRFPDWWWNWDGRSIYLQDVFEDLYALAPSSSTPSSLGNIVVRFQWVAAWSGWSISVDLAPTADCFYWVQRFPPQNAPYWLNIPDSAPATPFPDAC